MAISITKPGIVIDKNFLDGTKKTDVHALANDFTLIMPGALFYELLTTSPDSRRKCFSKLPATDNPVELVDHIGVLLKFEQTQFKPCGRPTDHRERLRFQFNQQLLNQEYSLPQEANDEIRRQAEEIETDIDRLVDLSELTPSLFPGLLPHVSRKGSITQFEAEQAIARSEDFLRFYETLKSPQPESPFPVISERPEQWAHFRWVQIQMLFATDLFIRYQGRLREQLSPAVRTKLEHDVHDAQVLALAVLEGAFATKELKLIRWWTLLRPDGYLYPPSIC